MPARVQLAARRKAFGYSQESLAHELQVTTSAVARWEQGTSTPKAVYRQPLARALGMSPVELERLLDVDGRRITGLDGGHVPHWLGHYASLEQSAAELRTFEPLVVPALLQTDGYAREVERAYHLPVTEEEVARRAEVRLARQAVLTRQPDPLDLFCVIDESILHRSLGGVEVMAAQLDHLVDVATWQNIDIRIVPLGAASYGAAFGAFQILTSPGSSVPYIACSEDLVGKHYHDGADAVAAHGELFRHLFERALEPDASIDLIRNRKELSYQC